MARSADGKKKMWRKGLVALLLLAVGGAMFTAAGAAPKPSSSEAYRAELDGNNMNPLVNTRASGTFDLSVADDSESITFRLSAKQLQDVTAVRIHAGNEYGDFGVLATLFESTPPQRKLSSMRGTIEPADISTSRYHWDTLLRYLRDGLATVRVDTALRPYGEIRGFLDPVEAMSKPMSKPNGNNGNNGNGPRR